MEKRYNPRPSDKTIRRRFPQYRSIEECPLEQQPDYLYDLHLRYTQSRKPDIRDFLEFMRAIGELPPR